jgi:hypothetical protein
MELPPFIQYDRENIFFTIDKPGKSFLGKTVKLILEITD